MLDTGRIASIIAADKYSRRKKQARLGQRYYDGKHDILEYRIYYITKDGKIKEDLTKSNIRIPHPFFHEIAEQEVAYILSNGIQFETDSEELKRSLTPYFGDNFIGEMKEILIDTVVRGFGYTYWYRDAKGIPDSAMQIPLGLWKSRMGKRRIQSMTILSVIIR